jgi:hypothetical protein
MTELKENVYYPKTTLAKAINCSPSWTNMILERPDFFKFRKLSTVQYARDPVYIYLYNDELIDTLKKFYRPRQNKHKQTLLGDKNE